MWNAFVLNVGAKSVQHEFSFPNKQLLTLVMVKSVLQYSDLFEARNSIIIIAILFFQCVEMENV